MEPIDRSFLQPPAGAGKEASIEVKNRIIKDLADCCLCFEKRRKITSARGETVSKKKILDEGAGQEQGEEIENSIQLLFRHLGEFKDEHSSLKQQCKVLKSQFRKILEKKGALSADDQVFIHTLTGEIRHLTKEKPTPIKRAISGERNVENVQKPKQKRKKQVSEHPSRATTDENKAGMDVEGKEVASTELVRKRGSHELEALREIKRRKTKAVLQRVGLSHDVSLQTGVSSRRLSSRSIHHLVMQRKTAVKKDSTTTVRVDSVASTAPSPPIQEARLETVLSHTFPEVKQAELYHVLGDAIGAVDKGITGYNQTSGWEWLASSLDAISEAGDARFKEKLVEQKNMLLQGVAFHRKIADSDEGNISNIGNELKEVLTSLPRGKSFILPGGWSKHAAVYEIRRSERYDGKFVVYVHNVGGGIQYHKREEFAGQCLCCCLPIDDVDIQQLCDPIFLACLQELDRPHEEAELDQKVMYESVLALLRGEVGQEQVSPFSENQRSGTCVFASYFAFLRSTLSVEEFERFELALGLKSLQEFTDRLTTNPSEQSEKSVALVEKTLVFFSQRVACCASGIDGDDLVVIGKSIERIQRVIEEIRESLAKKQNCISEKEEILPVTERKYSYPSPTYHPPSQVSANPTGVVLPFVDISDPNSMGENIKFVVDWAKQQKDNENELEAHFEIARFSALLLESFSVHKAQIHELPSETKLEIIRNICELSRLFFSGYNSMFLRTDSPFIASPLLIASVMRFVQCAKIAGNEIYEIEKYPIQLTGTQAIVATSFYQFEDIHDESVFFNCESDPDGDWAFSSPDEVNRGVFWTFFEDKYSDSAQQLMNSADKDRLIKLMNTSLLPKKAFGFALLDTSFSALAHTILPHEFLQFREMVDLLRYCQTSHGKKAVVIDGQQPLVRWEIRRGRELIDLHIQFTKSGKTPELILPPTPPLYERIASPRPDVIYRSDVDRYDNSSLRTADPSLTYAIATESPGVSDLPVEYRELAVVETDKTLQIDSLLSVFQTNPSLFAQQEWRNFFEKHLFSHDILQKLPQSMNTTPLIIADFLSTQAQMTMISPPQIELTLYFLRLMRRLYERAEGKEAFFVKARESLMRNFFSFIEDTVSIIDSLPETKKNKMRFFLAL